VVVGGGPIGFLCAELLRAAGRDVIVVQTSELRRKTLALLGHRVVASIAEITDRPQVVIDAAGAPEVLPWALDALGPQGVFVAAGYDLVEGLNLAPLARKELTVVGVRSGRREDLERIVALAASRAIRLPPIST